MTICYSEAAMDWPESAEYCPEADPMSFEEALGTLMLAFTTSRQDHSTKLDAYLERRVACALEWGQIISHPDDRHICVACTLQRVCEELAATKHFPIM